MPENQIHPVARNVVRIMALIVAAPAALALWITVDLIRAAVIGKPSLEYLLFGIGFWLFLAALCVGGVYIAYHGWFQKTSTSVRRLCGALAFFLYFMGQGIGDSFARGHAGYPESTLPYFSGSIIGAILFYLLLIGLLLPRLGFREDRSPTEQKRHIRSLFGYITLMILVGGMELSGAAPRSTGHFVPNPWSSYVIVGVLLLAALTYGIGPGLYWRIFSHPLPPALESPPS